MRPLHVIDQLLSGLRPLAETLSRRIAGSLAGLMPRPLTPAPAGGLPATRPGNDESDAATPVRFAALCETGAEARAHECDGQTDYLDNDVSVVIPVYNAAHSIGLMCVAIREALPCRSLHIVLVNDGSRDASHEACLEQCLRHPGVVSYLRLSRNFGEHNAVLAGLAQARGDYTLIIDDDFQNPPSETPRLLRHCIQGGYDVVYGVFREKRHSLLRNLASWANGIMADWLLGKPKGLYLSSFKCVNRFLREEVVRYQGPSPYLDGLILRVTDRVGWVHVAHHDRRQGVSGYTWSKLLNLWMNMALSFSPAPARAVIAAGLTAALGGLAALAGGGISGSLPWTLGGIGAMLSGAALASAGLAGEYAARVLQESNGAPQHVVRERHGAYMTRPEAETAAAAGKEPTP